MQLEKVVVVVGSLLPVLAARHRVDDDLSEETGMKSTRLRCLTNLDGDQVGDHLSAHLDQLVGQLCPGELHNCPLHDDGEGHLGLRGQGGSAADPGALKLGGKVVQVVGYQLVGCNLTWVELQLLMGEIEQVQACIAR